MIVFVFLSLFCLPVSADEGVILASRKTENGDGSYTVDVAISQNPGIKSISLKLLFDDALSISDIKSKESFGVGSVSDNTVSFTFEEENTFTGEILSFTLSIADKKDVGEKKVTITGFAKEINKNAAEGTEPGEIDVAVKDTVVSLEIECIEHAFGKWLVVKPASCTDKGFKQRTCSVCGEIEDSDIAQLEHTYSKWTTVTEPTCTEKGSKKAACTICDEETEKEVEPVGHTFDDAITTKLATLWSAGEQTGTCKVCEQIEVEEIQPNDYHPNTGVRIQAVVGAFEAETKTVVDLFGSLSTEYAEYKAYIPEGVTDYMVYDVGFELDGERVNPALPIRVAMPYRRSFTQETVMVYQLVEGELKPVEFTDFENYVIAEETYGGIYIITDSTVHKEVVEDDPVNPNIEVEEVDSLTKTIFIIVAAAAILFLAVLTYLTVRKR